MRQQPDRKWCAAAALAPQARRTVHRKSEDQRAGCIAAIRYAAWRGVVLRPRRSHEATLGGQQSVRCPAMEHGRKPDVRRCAPFDAPPRHPHRAAAAGLPLTIAAVRATAPPAQMFHWQGEVLDAVSELTLWHTDAALCRRTLLRVEAEIARYERISACIGRTAKSRASMRRGNCAAPRRSCAPSLKKASALAFECGRIRHFGAAAVAALRGAFLVARAHRGGHRRPRPGGSAPAGRFPPHRDRRRAHRVRTRRDGR